MIGPVVIAGASLAGLSVSRELRKHGYDGEIRLVDADDDAPYRRPALSKGIITGKQQPDDVRVPWPDELDLDRVRGTSAVGVDVEGHVLHCRGSGGDAIEMAYGSLVLATGASARQVTFGGECTDTLTVRSLAEGAAAAERMSSAHRIVVIGGGFIGLEVAAAASQIGRDVTVIEAAPVPLVFAVGELLGRHLAGIHRRHGVEIVCGTGVREIRGADRATGVVLDDGRTVHADLVITAVGSAPNAGWLAGSGLDASAGVICDAQCVPVGAVDMVAAGDVANWLNPLYGRQMRVEHWTNAIEQGGYAARHLLGIADPAGFASAPYFWSEQFDLRIQSVGSATGHDQAVVLDHDGDKIVVAYGSAGTLIAVAGVNAGAMLPKFRPLIEQRVPLADLAR